MREQSVARGCRRPRRCASGRRGDLLYVGHGKQGTNSPGFISIFAFPEGTPVAEISGIGFPAGLCADASGNVWAVEVKNNVAHAVKYARGGTKPIARILIPNPNVVSGCAVDPSTGDLATFNGVYASHGGHGPLVAVWRGARNRKPVTYPLPFTPTAGAYDPNGNLFVDGYIGGSQWFFLAELAKGSGSFTNISVNRHTEFPGGVQWDGSYITVATGGLGRRAVLYRLGFSGSHASVVGIVHPAQMNVGAFVVDAGVLAATSGSYDRKVLTWSYPQSATPTLLSRFSDTTTSLAISSGS